MRPKDRSIAKDKKNRKQSTNMMGIYMLFFRNFKNFIILAPIFNFIIYIIL